MKLKMNSKAKNNPSKVLQIKEMVILVLLEVDGGEEFYGQLKAMGQLKKSRKSKGCVFNEKFGFVKSGSEKYGNVNIGLRSETKWSYQRKVFHSVEMDLDLVLKPLAFNEVEEKWLSVEDLNVNLRVAVMKVPLNTEEEVQAGKVLGVVHRSTSINDQEDLHLFGRVFPQLWYSLPQAIRVPGTPKIVKPAFVSTRKILETPRRILETPRFCMVKMKKVASIFA